MTETYAQLWERFKAQCARYRTLDPASPEAVELLQNMAATERKIKKIERELKQQKR